jgi:uncharacterized damage-inducible protein DinB
MTQRNMVGTDEREALLGFLDAQRTALRTTAHGLTDQEAKLTPSASALSVAGLIKHAATVEREWTSILKQEPQANDFQKHAASFHPADTELADLLQDYEEAAEQTDATILEAKDLNQPVPIPRDVPWFPKDIDAWTVRWVLVHLIEETARHTGHADIVRESIDGAQAIELRAAAEAWPDSAFVKPWRPKPPTNH